MSKYGAAVDLWAVGCVIYETLHGQVPFYDEDEDEQLKMISLARLPPLPKVGAANLSDNGADFLLKLLEVNPNKRISIDMALDHPCGRMESSP